MRCVLGSPRRPSVLRCARSPFFPFDITMWKLVAAIFQTLRSNPSNKIHGSRSISPRREIDDRLVSPIETNGTKEKSGSLCLFLYIYIYIYRSLKRFFQFGWKFSRFIVDISWRTSVLDRRRSHNFHLPDSRWFPSAHMRLRLAIKDTPIKEINTREIGRAAEV